MYHLFLKLICSWFAFFLPAYSTFKLLSNPPYLQPEVERWLTYWCVLGCFVAVDLSADWIMSWIPFYYEIRSLFLLYLSLPQLQGSVYVYQAHLRPLLRENEPEIDHLLATAHSRVVQLFMDQIHQLVVYVRGEEATRSSTQLPSGTPLQRPPPGTPGSEGSPAGGDRAAFAGQLWNAWAPAIYSSLSRAGTSAYSRWSGTPASANPPTAQGAQGVQLQPPSPSPSPSAGRSTGYKSPEFYTPYNGPVLEPPPSYMDSPTSRSQTSFYSASGEDDDSEGDEKGPKFPEPSFYSR